MALGQISNVYDDQPYQDFYNLSSAQSAQSLGAGDRAARYADPFMDERANYQKRLRDLIANPGSQESSPFFKYLMETQMNQVNANNAARGLTKSGRGAMALQDRAAGVATQAYFPQVQALTQLAQGGASPAAAGLSYERGVRTSQDQAQAAAAARAAGRSPAPQSVPMSGSIPPASSYTGGGAPAPSYALPYSSGSSGSINTPGVSGYIDTANGVMPYSPSSAAGTGYVSSDYGTYDFGTPAAGDSYYTPSYGSAATPTYDYGNYDYGDYGGYDDSSYSDFGYGDYGGE